MGPLPGELRKACEAHVPAIAKLVTPQDREGNVLAHLAHVLTWKQAEALDWAEVGFWGPISRDPDLYGDATTVASSRAQIESTIGPTVVKFKHGILDAPICRRPFGVTCEEECPEGGGGVWPM